MCNAHNHSLFCTCGWGGEGHKGRSTGSMHLEWFRGQIHSSSFSKQRYHELTTYTFQDSTFASTCRYCGSKIFFVKHNDGIAVFDSLGWPWPKHNCRKEPEPNYFSGQHRQLNEIISPSGNFDDKVGIIRSYAWHDHCYCIIEILDKPNKLLYLKLKDKKISVKSGDIVILKKHEDCQICSIHGWVSDVEDANVNYSRIVATAQCSSLRDKKKYKSKLPRGQTEPPSLRVKEITGSQAQQALQRLAASKRQKIENQRQRHAKDKLRGQEMKKEAAEKSNAVVRSLDALLRDFKSNKSGWDE